MTDEWMARFTELVEVLIYAAYDTIIDEDQLGEDAARIALIAHVETMRAVPQPPVSAAEVPMPDIAGELFDGKRVCDEADVRTYGDAREAAGYVAGVAAGGKDAERLDWLSRQFVTVRIPMRYGSIECITGMPTDGDGESKPWDIRAAIDDAAPQPAGAVPMPEPVDDIDIALVPLSDHHRLTIGPAPWTVVRIGQKAFNVARAVFGTGSEDDDKRVYRTLQAYEKNRPQLAGESMRANFERWLERDSTLPAARDGDGYIDFTVSVMWHTWQAAIAALRGEVKP